MLYLFMHAGQLGLPPSREILLEHVVERKRMDDLAGSITDGRFHEQKVHHIDTKTWRDPSLVPKPLPDFISQLFSTPRL